MEMLGLFDCRPAIAPRLPTLWMVTEELELRFEMIELEFCWLDFFWFSGMIQPGFRFLPRSLNLFINIGGGGSQPASLQLLIELLQGLGNLGFS